MVIWVVKTFSVQHFCVSCHHFLTSSVSGRSLLLLSFIMPILAWNIPLISPIFLKGSLVFPILLFSSISLHVHLRRPPYLSLLFSGTVHSLGYISPFLPCFSLLFFSHLIVKSPDNYFAYCISISLGWLWSPPPVQCYKPPFKFLQALCLPGLIPWIYLLPPLYDHKEFDLGHTWMV